MYSFGPNLGVHDKWPRTNCPPTNPNVGCHLVRLTRTYDTYSSHQRLFYTTFLQISLFRKRYRTNAIHENTVPVLVWSRSPLHRHLGLDALRCKFKSLFYTWRKSWEFERFFVVVYFMRKFSTASVVTTSFPRASFGVEWWSLPSFQPAGPKRQMVATCRPAVGRRFVFP